jgi:hypothetical protein
MDARPDELTERIREKRIAIDNRLELLRVRLQQRDPRARLQRQWPALAGALVTAGSGLWFWRRARKRRNGSVDVRVPKVRRRTRAIRHDPKRSWIPGPQPRGTWDPWAEL